MRSHDDKKHAHAAAHHHDDAHAAGRANLAEHHATAAHAATAAPADPIWEKIDHHDDPAAKETIYGDQHHNPHSKHYEHHQKHAERHHAKVDRYNRKPIEDHAAAHVAGRPGVVANGKGLFMINKDQAIRYTFVRHGHANVATPFDVIHRDHLTTENYKATGKDPAAGKSDRLLANPAEPKMLHIDGKDHLCVMTWCGGQSAAWMRVDDLVDGHAIAKAAHNRAKVDDPKASSHDPEKLLHQTRRYVVRNDHTGQETPGDSHKGKEDVLGPGAKGGDNVSHYLSKDITKNAFDQNGQPAAGHVARSLLPLVMNLPEDNTPPIAIDTLLAGESFYVMNDKSFHRETPVFHNGKRHSNLLEKWVFGYVAMVEAGGHLRPDPNRRGWVPLRTLAEAKHLETHEIDQRT